MFDVEGDVPDLAADDRYLDAWVVARVNSHPRMIRVVDLTCGAANLKAQFDGIVRQSRDVYPGETRTVARDQLPHISVVVATIGERLEEIKGCLESLSLQEYPRFDVILVDNRPTIPQTDALSLLAQQWSFVELVHEPSPGASAARNCGIARATGEIVAFTDDDVVVGSDWLVCIGTEFARDPHLDVLTGLILPSELETPAQIWFENYYGGFAAQRRFSPVTLSSQRPRGGRIGVRDDENRLLETVPLYGVGAFGAGANTAYRATTIRRIGGFDEALGPGTPARGGEDLAVLMKVLWQGGRVRYQPESYVLHQHRRDYEGLLYQLEGYGLGFTAVLTSLVISDPRHLLAIATNFLASLRSLVLKFLGNFRGRNRATDETHDVRHFPSELARREYRGYFKGPGAYLKSRRVLARRAS